MAVLKLDAGPSTRSKGVQVTGQNIANANTEGYSRQVVHAGPVPGRAGGYNRPVTVLFLILPALKANFMGADHEGSDGPTLLGSVWDKPYGQD